jgi:hypothetical protein
MLLGRRGVKLHYCFVLCDCGSVRTRTGRFQRIWNMLLDVFDLVLDCLSGWGKTASLRSLSISSGLAVSGWFVSFVSAAMSAEEICCRTFRLFMKCGTLRSSRVILGHGITGLKWAFHMSGGETETHILSKIPVPRCRIAGN